MKVYIDDIRNPPDGSWTVVRSAAAFFELIKEYGEPIEISFDHDLGWDDKGYDLPTGYDIANQLVMDAMDGEFNFAKVKRIVIHSANPVGAKNIDCLFLNFFNFIKDDHSDLNIPLVERIPAWN